MKFKILLLKFLIGGSTVALSYIVSKIIPWEDFGGIFATFPAVFLLSMCISGIEYGDKMAAHVCKGAIFGMTGCLCCILTTWAMLNATGIWALSLIVGLATWFVSAMVIFTTVEHVTEARKHRLQGVKHIS